MSVIVAWQKLSDRTLWRAKNCDTWKPMGPFIATDLDPMNLTVSVQRQRQTGSGSYSTSKMLFSAQHYIAEISQYMTLWPGDVIWLGTDNATLPDLEARRRVRNRSEGHRRAAQPGRARGRLEFQILRLDDSRPLGEIALQDLA